jgi:hypothetical protein
LFLVWAFGVGQRHVQPVLPLFTFDLCPCLRHGHRSTQEPSPITRAPQHTRTQMQLRRHLLRRPQRRRPLGAF